MKPRDIILANLEHKPVPRPGMNFHRERLNDFVHFGLGAPEGYEQKRWQEGKVEYYDDIWGNIWKRMVGGSVKGEIHQPVIKDWDDLPKLQVPRHNEEACIARIMECKEQSDPDRFHIAGIGGWIFDNARYLRDMAVYFMDMALYPDELNELHAKVAQLYEQRIHIAGKAGLDGIMIGEDMGTQTGLLFSPDMFRQYFKGEYTRLMGLAHEYGMKVLMHSCGQNWDIVEDLCDCGVDAFQFDQPAVYDMPALAEAFKHRKVALYSPVDIQKVLPTGDREFIEAETRRMCDIFDGFLICKNYPDLPGIGVKEEWDQWAYEAILEKYGVSS